MEMIILILACFTIVVCAVPVPSRVLPPLLSQGGVTQAQRVVEATNQLPDAQTSGPGGPQQPQPGVPQQPQPRGPQQPQPGGPQQPQPGVPQQPQPGVPQQPQPGGPQQQGSMGGGQLLPPTQHYTWPPLGGSPINLRLQPSFDGSQPANQPILPQQPLILSPYRYIPLFSSPYGNQLFSPNGFPLILDSPLPQTPANPPPNSPGAPADPPSADPPSGAAPQQVQQQQNPHIVFMLQHPKAAPLGSLSSEELQMAARLGQLGVYLTTMLTNSPAGTVQPVSQAAGLVNPEQQSAGPTLGASLAGVQPTQGPVSSGPQLSTNRFPSGVEATVKAPIQEPLVCDCSNRQREQTTL
ncbi:proline-rich protein HaeIII subfamily 1-like isoform X2 [Pseudoliparis swirei]|uniref:proline-rich protein HaeIII subfamily 1-like isoform X2 n=1 Tax=Pseudoliparis swirei TaxID=2059687 RepID=UPI0024BE65F3|nr:proline-rich protein HaeIII subfamily 1-like isoform X2 [Pseudoliparis swirei]